MRLWNDWADEHWDVVALAVAFTTALAFAATLVLAFNAFARQVEPPSMLPVLSAPRLVEDMRATLPTDLP